MDGSTPVSIQAAQIGLGELLEKRGHEVGGGVRVIRSGLELGKDWQDSGHGI